MKVIISCAFFSALVASAFSACPRIYTRDEWGARPPNGVNYLSNPVDWAIVHHAASAPCSDFNSCSSLVRSFQNLHMDTNGWDDIGYSFIVGEDGAAYEGRGWSRVGAHTPGFNSIGLGICVIGNFMDHVPNDAALNALQQLIDCGVEQGYISGGYGLLGHRQATSTACPGDQLYNLITGWPHWTQI